MIKKWLLGLTLCSINLMASDLDRIIPPEIKNDAFYSAIYRLAKSEPVKTILEIGSSSGEGSTEAFARGIKENPAQPTLFCMELSLPRFNALNDRYQEHSQVTCYNVSSVPLNLFPAEETIVNFMRSVNTSLRGFREDEVIGWLRQDIEYVQEAGVPQNGIELIKAENGIEHFDMVLIDGSEFTGPPELDQVYGAAIILLDDIRAYKNYNNFQRLSKDPNYQLVELNRKLRYGYAVFRKK